MSVLDELREGLLSGLHPSDAETFGDYFADVFRDFEAGHPGLVDETIICCRCGKAAVQDYYRDIDICPACSTEATP